MFEFKRTEMIKLMGKFQTFRYKPLFSVLEVGTKEDLNCSQAFLMEKREQPGKSLKLSYKGQSFQLYKFVASLCLDFKRLKIVL